MKNRIFASAAVAAGLAIAVAGCSSSGDTTDEATASADATMDAGSGLPESLTLALVPSDDVEQITTDGEALAGVLSDELGIPVEVFVPDSYNAVVVALQTGQADIGFLGPIAMWQAHEEAGAEIVLQALRYGSSEYVGQWFTNDPGTYCLDDVTTEADDEGINYSYCNGATGYSGPQGEDALALVPADASIAWTDATSASGYYFPATQLATILGVDPINDLTGGFFAGGHSQTVQAVYDGEAAIGLSYNDARSNLAEEFSDVGEKVVVFAYTDNIPNDGVVLSGDLDASVQETLTQALLDVAATEDGLAALAAVYDIEGLEAANQDAFENFVAPTYENFGSE
ncbi:phosphate/phosphite/phosphonate ABC transporter substrate-binding protein [Demequina sp. SYSU T00039]|uniref:Phosphate/phosphite/phosphonate ABC transporter substrate-binding protein n=1 Tax=Demequina lignilytica TaxID=3051663 RepID=A0AAW7M8G2_9MICO|nr:MULTISPECIES: phosphate/phosphite/phosphonate ABC transporter substrate-binding protein [unclassified Demequina]MDN4478497.1 phosphate/phosphite/phosphonate ABC transporter substrate-binding protein [Demequina sp. SYSU T00039-1]MDN4486996.1 phosphate/phosphite/phosphonate ABC transporter substrate-binding protein [Demequina sp. SYSU T00039]MDN4489707.1 phosphate/phosphite/phosphonate ABC transporter substrate-binding protein [Demequina sp. SYSU T00068]